MYDDFAPTLDAALSRIAAVHPRDYARTRNAVIGAVSGLSPYITHGLVSLREVLSGVAARHPLQVQDKFVYELGWREYFRHLWQHRGEGILRSLHPGALPDESYATTLPADIREAVTGVPVVDGAVRTLYRSGMLHNHARMWLASYVVHVRQVHWRVGADWLYGHLLDGDLASNHLSWQWVAGTASRKPYLFNADNVARYAPVQWHSPGSVIDTTYEALDRLARTPRPAQAALQSPPSALEPPLLAAPPADVGAVAPRSEDVAGRDVWLLHPWMLGALPADLSADSVVLGVLVADFHQRWPWSLRRWQFVGRRLRELSSRCWEGDAASIAAALAAARSVRSVAEPHLAPWLPRWADCTPAPALFPLMDRRCDSFSQWWTRVTRGLRSVDELLAAPTPPPC